jgi:hypothetical protein
MECFNRYLGIFTYEEFPEKWQINKDALEKCRKYISIDSNSSRLDNLANAMMLLGQYNIALPKNMNFP